MQRTESKSIQVHPLDEQAMITVMQEFMWNLKSSQEIKLRNQEIAGVTSTTITMRTHSEHYIKLVFERPYDFPNRDKLLSLENEFFNMQYPLTGSIKFQIILGIIALLFIATIPIISVIVIAVMAFWGYSVVKKNKEAMTKGLKNDQRKQEILREAAGLTV